MSLTVVYNRLLSTQCIQISNGISTRKGKDGKVLDPRPAKVVMLVPGANLVPTEDWIAAKELASVRQKLVTEIEDNPAPEAEEQQKYIGKPMLAEGAVLPDANPLKDMTADQVETFVAEVLTPATVRRWLNAEGRPDVRLVLEKRAAFLETGGGSGVLMPTDPQAA